MKTVYSNLDQIHAFLSKKNYGVNNFTFLLLKNDFIKLSILTFIFLERPCTWTPSFGCGSDWQFRKIVWFRVPTCGK